MHELSLAGEIVRLVEAAATREHFRRVATLRLEVGAMAGVDVSALRFALDAMVAGTCLAGAQIEVDEPPGRAWCEACAAEVAIDSRADPCPRCSAYPLRVTRGTEFRVRDLLVRDD